MKYKVGDRVKIKSLDWYYENSDDDYNVVFADGWHFSKPMSIFCGKELIIEKISHATNPPYYTMNDNTFGWTDEMIEGLVEEETKPKFKVGDKITNGKGTVTILTLTSDSYILEDTFGECGTLYFKYQDKWKIVEEEVGLVDELSSRWVNEFNLPNGYIFKDENGNVINATKIVLEKKKKEYPKTYEECCKVLNIAVRDLDILENMLDTSEIIYSKNLDRLLNSFRKLLICRDAYWKIAGEEMGLGKPWEPDWNNISDKYCIYFVSGEAWSKECQTRQAPFAFPTAEMRDAFYENFKEDIEFCKELL